MLDQSDASLFQNESDPLEQALDQDQKLVEFQGAVYELEDALRHLDEWIIRENAAKEAALAEYENMKKLRAFQIGDPGYEQTVMAEESTSCRYCGRLSRSGFCYKCNC